MKLAAASFTSDVVFGIAMVITLDHLARTGELPMTPWGFRAFSGPFEALGKERFAALGWAFVGLCVIDALVGLSLWRGQRRGGMVGLAMTPPMLVLGAGFALPFLVVPAPIRAGLVIAGWRRLR